MTDDTREQTNTVPTQSSPASANGRELAVSEHAVESSVDARLLLDIPGTITKTSLELDENLAYDDWSRVGMILSYVEEGVHWWLGDWWRYGERKYGEMASNDVQEGIQELTGYAYHTVRTDGYVADRVEFERRRSNLTFNHHKEVASLDVSEQEYWLDRAEREGMNRNALRAALKEHKYLDAQSRALTRNGTEQAHGIVYRMSALELLDHVDNASVDLLLTDPPYATDVDDVYAFAMSWLGPALERVKPSGRAFICIGSYANELHAYLDILLREQTLFDVQVLVWEYRNTMGPTPAQRYKTNWQAILHCIGPEAPPLQAPVMLEQLTVHEIAAPQGDNDRVHEWQKPDELARRLINHTTEEGDRVLDLYAGTGAFIAQAAAMGRHAIGSEIDDDMLALCERRGLMVR